MNYKYLFAGAMAVALGAGCTQPADVAKNDKNKAYYHDRRVGLGTNIPRTYADAAAANANDTHQSDMDREQFQQFTNQTSGGSAALGQGAPSAGGH